MFKQLKQLFKIVKPPKAKQAKVSIYEWTPPETESEKEQRKVLKQLRAKK